MKLSELIARYGDDRVQFQNLDQCADALNMGKNGTKITFGTEQRLTPEGTEQLGIVVWMDRKTVAEIIATAKSEGREAINTHDESGGTNGTPLPGYAR